VDLRRQRSFRNIILVGLVIAGIWYFSRYVLFLIALAYMFSGALWRLQYVVRKPGAPPPPPPLPELGPEGFHQASEHP